MTPDLVFLPSPVLLYSRANGVVYLTGFEPAAYRVGVCRSIQLSYKYIHTMNDTTFQTQCQDTYCVIHGRFIKMFHKGVSIL